MESLGKHLPGAISAATSRARRETSHAASASSAGTTEPKAADTEERAVLLAKLFHAFPAQGDRDAIALRMAVYHEELLDIHAAVLRLALRRLWRDHKRGNFLPAIAEIRRSAAFVIRAMRGGRNPDAPESAELPDIDHERYLAVGPKPGEALPQLASGAPKRLTAGA
jgi:hypothetical protein